MCPSLGLKSDSFHYSHKYVFFFFIAAISSLEMTDMWNLLRSHFSLLTTKTFLTGFSKNGREWVLPFPFHSNTGQPLDWKPLRRLSLIPKGGAVVRVDKLQNPPLPESLWHCFLQPPYLMIWVAIAPTPSLHFWSNFRADFSDCASQFSQSPRNRVIIHQSYPHQWCYS